MPCLPLANLSSVREKLGAELYDKVWSSSFYFFDLEILYNSYMLANIHSFPNKQLDVIGIDEAQFFEDLYDFCCKAADHDGKTVIIAGLDGDYLRWCFIFDYKTSNEGYLLLHFVYCCL